MSRIAQLAFLAFFTFMTVVFVVDRARKLHIEKKDEVKVPWVIGLDCGQFVTSTPDIEVWLLNNADKKIVDITRAPTKSTSVYYVVYLVPQVGR